MALLDYPLVLFVASLVVLIACVEIGVRLERREIEDQANHSHEQVLRARDEIAVLLSLLLGFTLAMVLSRFDVRKQLVIEEANAIGTTSLRAAMLPGPNDTNAQGLLRQYADARLDFSK